MKKKKKKKEGKFKKKTFAEIGGLSLSVCFVIWKFVSKSWFIN
jgi:hypothetical protein